MKQLKPKKCRWCRELFEPRNSLQLACSVKCALDIAIAKGDKQCISCDRHHKGQYHAGHYRPAGVNSALRFEPRNVHKQCSVCNNHKSGNLTAYRAAIVRLYGEDVAQWLDNNHDVRRWAIDELKAIDSGHTEIQVALAECHTLTGEKATRIYLGRSQMDRLLQWAHANARIADTGEYEGKNRPEVMG